jgi:imidazolonepropionase
MTMATTFDVLVTGAHLATMAGGTPYGAIRDGAIGIAGDKIAWVGVERELPSGTSARRSLDARGSWVTPGLIDCHTHLVYAGSRVDEFEARLNGATYTEIAQAGGGIKATVRATRAATDEELVKASLPRLRTLADEGATTVEIKSGYGLDTKTELRQLSVARRIGTDLGVDVRTTLLAAHALPPEYSGRADDYIDLVCDEIIPAAVASGLADAVDAFCDTIGFTAAQTRRVFAAARAHGLPVKLHADQLSDTGGAALAAEFDGLSADHVEYTSGAGVEAMATQERWQCCCRALSTHCARRACRRLRRCASGESRWRSPPTATLARRRRRRCR